ncbi:hypothetical protein LCGC14_1843310 [marine sediment metagenome]|uniref:Prepilin-type N-terminal cleavage/methylation domain-containing protein n=1 Tax=marine sediment metagenome TaxID=412755 RepID=A0A0F9IS53_9ZZZZ
MKKPSRHMKNLIGCKKDFSINYQPLTLNRRGFSLVEVMVAAIILGISLMAIYAVYIKTFEASGRAETKTVAASIAQRTMESAINKPYANIALMSTASPTPPTSFVVTNKDPASTTVTESVVLVSSGTPTDYVTYQQTISEKGINYTVTTIISWHDDADDQTAPDDPDPNDYKRVHVTVTWPGATAPVTLDRFVSMYYRPNAHTTAGADAGKFQEDNRYTNPKYANLGSVNLETYTGGNKTAKAEAFGVSSTNKNSSDDIAWVEEFTDDDSGAEYPVSGNSSETLSSFSDPTDEPIITMKASGNTIASAAAGALSNIIGTESWHTGEFPDYVGWPDDSSEWPSPPGWVTTWLQPSSIAKSDLSGGIEWDYLPVPHAQNYKLFETGASLAGTKSVITSETSSNKAVSRSWSRVENILIVKMTMQSAGKSVVSIDSVEASVQGEANGEASGLKNTVSWVVKGLVVYDPATSDAVSGIPAVIDSTDDLPIISWPEPIKSITVGDVTENVDAGRAEASVTAITIELNENTILLNGQGQNANDLTIPASKITLGTAQTNVSYTIM